MTPQAKLTIGLLGLAVLAGTALGLGVGRPPRPVNPGVAALRDESRDPGRKLFSERQCVVCHGLDGKGTEMGPGLGNVIPEYLAAAGGDRERARAMLVAYLKDPKGVRTLRRDGSRYPNPMPSAAGLGLDEKNLKDIADFLLGFRPRGTAVGGDSSDR